MVGFNNNGYDYTVIHDLICRGGHITAGELYHKSQAIFNTTDRFGLTVWESDWYVPQIDLYKIHHFDNKSRYTSLKMLEFNMRSQNIQDLPFEPGRILTDAEIDHLIKYNDHDLDETIKFLIETLPMIEFRDELSAKHNRNFVNHNDGKIGSDYFIMELERLGVPCYHRPNGKKEPRQTIRESINLNSVMLPWINFQHPEFQCVANWLRSQTITETKGVFEYIDVSPEMARFMDPKLIKVHGLRRCDLPNTKITKTIENQLKKGYLLSKCDPDFLTRSDLHRFKFISGWKDHSGLNCTINGFKYDFGTGGIHGSIDSQIVSSDDDYQLIDLDVASYYPNLAIANRFYPEHLGEQFCDIYEDIYNQRKQYDKGTMENDALKYALNVPYGQSNSQYAVFFDSAYTMTITINGQLLLCLLAEYLSTLSGLTMIQINTDGLTVRCPRNQINSLTFIAKSWEELTGLELERADYSRMMIRDVNNYIGEYEDGKLKRKGAYGYGDDLAWHQNHSSQIVARAAEAALVRGVPIRDTVLNHSDKFDFMLRTKVPRSSRLFLEYADGRSEQLQNITRYYASHNGGSLIKVMPPTPKQVEKDPAAPDRRIGIDVGCTVEPCNNMDQYDSDSLNYEYYIAEAEKLVKPLVGHS